MRLPRLLMKAKNLRSSMEKEKYDCEEPLVTAPLLSGGMPTHQNMQGTLPLAYAVALPELPSALQLLESSSGFFIREKANWFEEITGWELGNKYKIYWRPQDYPIPNPTESDLRALASNHVFDAIEESDTCSRQCCGPARAFNMHVYDTRTRQEIFFFDRPFNCTLPCECFCCGCILAPQTLVVRDVNGNAFSTVMQSRRNCSCSTWLDIYDGEISDAAVGGASHMFSVEKFCCQLGPNCICPSVELAIKTGDGGEGSRTIGRLSNMWAGFNAKGLCSRADNYSVEFDRLFAWPQNGDARLCNPR